ncbi:hypothetical protein ACJ41O_014987 [Fusarium nematophilum]
MDKLPYALVSLIVSCLLEDDEGTRKPWSKPPPIAQYASISRAWQDAVERHTFSHVKVKSDDFSRFEAAFRHAHRRQAVSSINYEIVLPAYSQGRCWKFERPREHAENKAAFSRAVHAFFSSLHAWQEEEAISGASVSVSRPIALNMTACCRLDSGALQRKGIGLYRMDGNFLDFVEPCTAFSSLRTLYLNWDSSEPVNHSFIPSDLRDPSQLSTDAFSKALHVISQSLPITELFLYGPVIISPELFWPNDSQSPDPLPHWPTLQYLTVNASILTPDGSYYYTGTPESESEDDDPWWPESPRPETDVDAADYPSDDSRVRDPFNRLDVWRSSGSVPLNGWRRELDPERFNPLLLALSRAACCMPELRELEFYMGMSDAQGPSGIVLSGEVDWEAESEAGGIREVEYVTERRWKVKTGSKAKWEPGEEVVDLWRQFVGRGGVITREVSWSNLTKDVTEVVREVVRGDEQPDVCSNYAHSGTGADA